MAAARWRCRTCPCHRPSFDFVPLGLGLLTLLVGITLAYVLANEAIKHAFGKRVHV